MLHGCLRNSTPSLHAHNGDGIRAKVTQMMQRQKIDSGGETVESHLNDEARYLNYLRTKRVRATRHMHALTSIL